MIHYDQRIIIKRHPSSSTSWTSLSSSALHFFYLVEFKLLFFFFFQSHHHHHHQSEWALWNLADASLPPPRGTTLLHLYFPLSSHYVCCWTVVLVEAGCPALILNLWRQQRMMRVGENEAEKRKGRERKTHLGES